jgi:3-hydroxy acid dehydrogenase/malonic semialdehyde reductase
VRVTDIEPGLSKTEFSLIRFKGKEDVAEGVYKDTEPLTPVDIAESVYWAASQPAHVNINTIELMATCQAFSPFNIVRGLKLKD